MQRAYTRSRSRRRWSKRNPSVRRSTYYTVNPQTPMQNCTTLSPTPGGFQDHSSVLGRTILRCFCWHQPACSHVMHPCSRGADAALHPSKTRTRSSWTARTCRGCAWRTTACRPGTTARRSSPWATRSRTFGTLASVPSQANHACAVRGNLPEEHK